MEFLLTPKKYKLCKFNVYVLGLHLLDTSYEVNRFGREETRPVVALQREISAPNIMLFAPGT